jgi:hypothetical protein
MEALSASLGMQGLMSRPLASTYADTGYSLLHTAFSLIFFCNFIYQSPSACLLLILEDLSEY